jgi:hypothetical protein
MFMEKKKNNNNSNNTMLSVVWLHKVWSEELKRKYLHYSCNNLYWLSSAMYLSLLIFNNKDFSTFCWNGGLYIRDYFNFIYFGHWNDKQTTSIPWRIQRRHTILHRMMTRDGWEVLVFTGFNLTQYRVFSGHIVTNGFQ